MDKSENYWHPDFWPIIIIPESSDYTQFEQEIWNITEKIKES